MKEFVKINFIEKNKKGSLLTAFKRGKAEENGAGAGVEPAKRPF